MVKRYRFGLPIETDAIQKKPELSKEDFPIRQEGNMFILPMEDQTIVYGLGENVRGINKRGWIYESNCSDNPNHLEHTKSLYGAHNFVIISDEKQVGIFVDTPGKVTFDVGYTKRNEFVITLEEMNCEIYLLEGDTPDDVVKEFRALIGRSYIPPKWAFGYGQCRWSYMSSDEVRTVAEKHRDDHIPIDMIYLDIDYMERYKDFTINGESFADFEELVKEMKAQNIHLVPIIDAGVKVEEGYDIYEEGLEKGYFCKDENGEEFVVGVWPGKCLFPDVLNEEAGAWFAGNYKRLLDMGIDGFWNDMNEPAIFYSQKHLQEVFDRIEEYKQSNLDIGSFFEFTGMIAGISNNEKDYKSFYHNYRGEKIRHDKVHNLFGYYMTRRANEAFEKLIPEKRILMFSRASYIGMHRYGGIWQGDNQSWWSHLLMNIKMMPSLNMCGFLYTGADLGGFGSHTTEDLMVRWLSFGIFTPLMRNHAAMGTRRQEVYEFENSMLCADVIRVRYRLLPYLYSEYMKAALKGTMMFRPLGFVYWSDEIARQIEDQLLLGDELMIAPVYEQNAIGRVVYLPEKMKLLRFREGRVMEQCVLEKGHHFVKMPLGDVCIFLRWNAILPISKGGENVTEVDYVDLELYRFGENPSYEYYMDDGETKEYSFEDHVSLLF